jgi:hypothetical protein
MLYPIELLARRQVGDSHCIVRVFRVSAGHK